MGEELWDRFKGGREGTLWYHRELLRAFRNAESTPQLGELLNELDRALAELEALAGHQL
jgi:hypothetical protein